MEQFPQLVVDRGSPTPLSDQLTHNLRELILSGATRPGESLPPSRLLAETLLVSRSVVVSAYERLVGEGYLESQQGSGTRVVEELPDWVVEPTAVAVERDPEAASEAATSTPPIDLRPGRPYTPPSPPREWVRALTAAAREPWRSDAPDSRGEPALRRAIADQARRSRGIDCDAEDAVVTTGTSEALAIIALALRELRGREPRIAVEDPGYIEGAWALRRAGATLVPIPVGDDGVTAAGLRALAAVDTIDAVMVTPSHQYPLGGRIPAVERHAILSWAEETGAYVIEDDYDSEFRHDGAVLPAMASLDRGGAVIYVTTLNKVLSPSLRCGAIVLGRGQHAEALRAAVFRARQDLGEAVSAMIQRALAAFLSGGGFRREVGRTRREYRHRRELLLAECTKLGLTVTGAAGGLHVVIPLAPGKTGLEVVAQLEKRGVLVGQVQSLADEGGPDGIIVGYGAESVSRTLQGVERIAAVMGVSQV
ncbi:PLP-dependent aminotransferase family protein [Leucobacter viscericola]|uniref:PLP-dependent aminotransferase family protein n=1 Tax=Leucobacter viscericola TaxID=2714935 RepID=A0A6G7XEV4_9MICO|nr:PLP-dependent aminotransferase family protein [Leucobacter viscericola]QIK62927.1 PLP-dependent aminotransferase family protein [Leucobacter viscericola]